MTQKPKVRELSPEELAVEGASDQGEARTLMDPRDLSDLREIGNVIGSPADGEIPAAIVPPDDGSRTSD